MEEIIYLEPDEEIPSVIDKIKRAVKNKLGLVVPRDATILQSVVNLRLLAKEAKNLNKEIAIVTTDRIGRHLASQVGLTVFASVKDQGTSSEALPVSQEDDILEINPEEKESTGNLKVHHFQDRRPVINWRSGAKPVLNLPKEEVKEPPLKQAGDDFKVKKTSHHHFPKVLWPIIGVVIVLILAAGFLILPHAQVKVYVLAEDLNKSIPLTITPNVSQVDEIQNVLPGNLLEVTKEVQQKFPATGQKDLGGKAKGTITVYNLWESNSRRFSAGTKFTSSSKTFLATSAFTLPGSAISEGNLVPGTVNITIEAENAGEDYNIKAGRFILAGIPAAQQDKIYGNSSQEMSGGFTKIAQVVSQSDYDTAKNQLMSNFNSEINSELVTKAGSNKIVDAAKNFSEPEIITTAKVDQEAKEFEMKIKGTAQLIVFDWQTLNDLLVKVLSQKIPSDKMVVIPSEESVVFAIDKIGYDKKELNLSANVLAKVVNNISTSELKTEILGKTEARATEILKKHQGVSRVEIDFWPAFLKRVPDLVNNVKIKIEYTQEGSI